MLAAPSALRHATVNQPGKNEPFRSWPISANELEDVDSGAEANVRSPTVPVHSICAEFRTNSPANPPKTGSVFLMFTRSSTPLHTTLNETVPGIGVGPPPKREFVTFP